jgi:hypothetical protein
MIVAEIALSGYITHPSNTLTVSGADFIPNSRGDAPRKAPVVSFQYRIHASAAFLVVPGAKAFSAMAVVNR